MCGIIGYTGASLDAVDKLVDGLKCLEHRGYDSSGIAMQSMGGYKNKLCVRKAIGSVKNLVKILPTNESFSCGIGHNRWATHGKVTQANAHPHVSSDGRVAIVHNGVIDNADFLRSGLIEDGYKFKSETDSEVITHLLDKCYAKYRNAKDALNVVTDLLSGTYGIVALFADIPQAIFIAKNGSPIVVGLGDGENYVASDTGGLPPHIAKAVHLKDGECAVITRGSFRLFSKEKDIDPKITDIDGSERKPDKGIYPHYMLKEIKEQPASITRAFSGRIRDDNCVLGGFNTSSLELSTSTKVVIIGCGTSYHAGLIASLYVEKFARMDATVKLSSEFSTSNFIPDINAIYIAISQSGETFDTIEAVKELLNKGCSVFGIINKVGSTLARLCGRGAYIHAGHEVSVASTKAFTSQLAALAMFAIMLGRATSMNSISGQYYCRELKRVPKRAGIFLHHKLRIKKIQELAKEIAKSPYVLFLGRGVNYPVAMEGALKLKEIAYIPCDAYAGGEMKHGPIAMIEEGTNVIAIVDYNGPLATKMLGNIEELMARGARVHVVSANIENFTHDGINIKVTHVEDTFSPFISVLPLQLLAYYTALEKGYDIDMPRNLAKVATTI